MSDLIPITSLGSLLAAIASSPIVVPAARLPARDFAGWCAAQKPADIDTMILNWIKSHASVGVSH